MQLIFEILRSTQADDPYAFRSGAQEYVLRTTGGGVETATLNWDAALLADLERLRHSQRDAEVRQRVGERLRRFLYQTGFAESEGAILAAVERGEPVYLTLRLAAAELYALPWELLTIKGSGQHLGELRGVLLRYAWPDTATAAAAAAVRLLPGRILFAWSAALGAVPAREHQAAIARACERGEVSFEPARDVLSHASYGRLASALQAAAQDDAPITVLHILCHGTQSGASFGIGLDPDEGDGPGGRAGVVDAARLRQLLSPHAERLRLVVLCACDSANQGELGTQLGSVAQALHRAGIAAVVASRFPMSVAGSVRLTETLYESLLVPPDSLEQAVLAARQRLLAESASLDWAGLQLYARPEDGDDTRPLSFPPFRGLKAFLPSHHRFFFGRESECAQAVAALGQLHAARRPRFLLITGASGTGKSSVVLAGLLPALLEQAGGSAAPSELRQAAEELLRLVERQGTSATAGRPGLRQALETVARELAAPQGGVGGWEYVVMRPGAAPLQALGAALDGRRERARPLLLVVDQLEEVFTQVPDDKAGERQAFASRLWALSQEDSGVSVVATLRVDFLGQCGELVLDGSGLRLDRVAYDDRHRIFVAQLGPESLRLAIEGPARRVGLTLSPGLAQQMIADVQGEPGALPLLEYVLLLLWQRRTGRELGAASYAALGGVQGALEASADRIYESLPAEQQRVARRLLASLVHIGEGEVALTRRRVAVAELEGQLGPTTATVLAAFVEARLLVYTEDGGRAMVEVAHEALIRKWARLRSWLREDKERLGELLELERWARQWRDFGTPLRGSQLGYATRVLAKYPGELGPAITEMIRSSQLQSRRRRARIVVALSVVMALLSGLALLARLNQGKAERQARIALSRLLSDRAARELGSEPDLALLLAARAFQLNEEFDSRSTLAAVLERTRHLRAFLRGPTGQVHSVSWSPDGRLLAAAGDDPAVWLYDIPGANLARGAPLHGPEPTVVNAVAFSPDGRLLAAGGANQKIWLFDVSSRRLAGAPLTGDLRTVYSLDFSADGRLLAAGIEDGRVLLFDVASRRQQGALAGHGQAVAALSIYRGGAPLLASGSGDGTARLWALDKAAPLFPPLSAGQEYVSSVAFSPDGTLLATGGLDRNIVLWDVTSGQRRPGAFAGHKDAVSGVLFADGGRLLASCAHDGRVLLWDTVGGQPSPQPIGQPLTVGTGPLESCALSPDGQLLVAGGQGQILLWELTTHAALLRKGRRSRHGVSALALSGDGGTLAIGDAEGRLRFLDVGRDQVLGEPLQVHHGAINSVAWSPDGRTVATCGSDRTVGLVDARSHGSLGVLPPRQQRSLSSLAYSPRGDRLAVASSDGTVLLWDPVERSPVGAPIVTRQHSATAVAWSPDGKLLGTGGIDGTIVLWGPDGTQRCPPLTGAEDGITSLAWSPDGQLLAAGSRDHTVSLWQVAGCPAGRGEPLRRHSDAVAALAWSRDGTLLASGGQDSLIVLWDVRSRQPLGLPLVEHKQPIAALAFGPDGLLVSGDSELLKLWDTRLSDRRACSRANRNLTQAEWLRYVDDSRYCRVCRDLPAGEAAPVDAPACRR